MGVIEAALEHAWKELGTMNRSVRWSALTGLLLSVILAGPTAAATWNPPVRVAGGYALALATTGNTALAAYRPLGATDQISIRRSTDGGATWSTPLTLATDAYGAAIAARQNNVEVVWGSSGRIWYVRSTNTGLSYNTAVPLSPATGFAIAPSIAHGPAGVVAVGWIEGGNVRVRVSTDDGATFSLAKTIGSAEPETNFAIAAGDGVIYAAYFREWDRLRLKTSLDGGDTWSAALAVANNAFGDEGLTVAASGAHAYVAYTADHYTIRYRRTVNSGSSWSDQIDLSQLGQVAFEPRLSLRGGVLRAAYTTMRCQQDYCDSEKAWYRQTSNGLTWGTAVRVAPNSFTDSPAAGIGYAGRPIVLLTGFSEVDGAGVWVRTRSQ